MCLANRGLPIWCRRRGPSTSTASEFTPEMARLLDPAEGMKSREVVGGTGPQAVAKALAEARARLNQTRV